MPYLTQSDITNNRLTFNEAGALLCMWAYNQKAALNKRPLGYVEQVIQLNDANCVVQLVDSALAVSIQPRKKGSFEVGSNREFLPNNSIFLQDGMFPMTQQLYLSRQATLYLVHAVVHVPTMEQLRN